MVLNENLEKRRLSYNERAKLTSNKLAIKIFNLMEEKQSNLALANDITDSKKFLELTEKVADEIIVLKTHIDILEDFNIDIIKKIEELADKHKFFIFEDRKFADIGNTVKLQYSSGIFKISKWAHIINAHSLVGNGLIEGLKECIKDSEDSRGCLLLAQMSSSNNLIDKKYTLKTVELAEKYQEFVIGFIGNGSNPKELKKLASLAKPNFLIFTPGINISDTGKLGQNYATPQKAIKSGSDIIIVGSGIYKAEDPIKSAKEYRKLGWKAYLKRIK